MSARCVEDMLMFVKAIQQRRKSGAMAFRRGIVVAAVAAFAMTSPSAYIGDSFLLVPGVAGGWNGAHHKGWVRLRANVWKTSGAMKRGRSGCGVDYRDCYSGPVAPRQGAGALVISVDKQSPVLPHLMDRCLKNTPIAELTFAEASERLRAPGELGPRPAAIPEYYEYALKDARLSECTVVADAPEQAFVVNFSDIQWVNYKGGPEGERTAVEPPTLKPVQAPGGTKTFVVTWFGLAHDVASNQCPAMNTKPTVEDYLASLSPEAAAQARIALQGADEGADAAAGAGGGGGAGGAGNASGSRRQSPEELIPNRGPNGLNVSLLPGIVRDPGNAAPQTTLAHGFDLDGHDGTGPVPAGACRHPNYRSPDGRTGIDNQFYAVWGCTPGYLGRKGLFNEFMNARHRDGKSSILIEINGVDNDRHDDSVDVTVFYSEDRMVQNSAGAATLPDYTYRVSTNPDYTPYFTRIPARIVNGVVITEPVKSFRFKMGDFPDFRLTDTRMRFEIGPDGSLKGLLGGYQDWRKMLRPEFAERYFNHHFPGTYNAMKRAADGMKDPVTGECTGISSAFELDGVRAFTSERPKRMTQAGVVAKEAR